jgi:hypothetical protein
MLGRTARVLRKNLKTLSRNMGGHGHAAAPEGGIERFTHQYFLGSHQVNPSLATPIDRLIDIIYLQSGSHVDYMWVAAAHIKLVIYTSVLYPINGCRVYMFILGVVFAMKKMHH